MRLRRERNLLQNNFLAQMSQNLVFIFCKILRFEQFCYCTLFATIIIIDKKNSIPNIHLQYQFESNPFIRSLGCSFRLQHVCIFFKAKLFLEEGEED